MLTSKATHQIHKLNISIKGNKQETQTHVSIKGTTQGNTEDIQTQYATSKATQKTHKLNMLTSKETHYIHHKAAHQSY